MKGILALVFSFFVLTACQYKVPITTVHNIPVEHHVLGAWKIIPAENENDDTHIRIFKFSDTEYTVHYLEDGGDLYFRAYIIDIAGITAVQLELIGTDDGPVAVAENDRYQVVSYQLENGLLKISTLNSDLVDDELSDSESLRNAFIHNKNNPELFNDPGVFERISD